VGLVLECLRQLEAASLPRLVCSDQEVPNSIATADFALRPIADGDNLDIRVSQLAPGSLVGFRERIEGSANRL
jgi:hypothetical protein